MSNPAFLEQVLNVIHAVDVCHLQQFTDFCSTGVFFRASILSGHIFFLHPDASILHLSGGSHNYWDGLQYCHMIRLCKIWAAGSFAVLNEITACPKLRKRGISAVTNESQHNHQQSTILFNDSSISHVNLTYRIRCDLIRMCNHHDGHSLCMELRKQFHNRQAIFTI